MNIKATKLYNLGCLKVGRCTLVFSMDWELALEPRARRTLSVAVLSFMAITLGSFSGSRGQLQPSRMLTA